MRNNWHIENFKQYQVTDVKSVEEFIDRYYKKERIRDLRQILINSRIHDLKEFGIAWISNHDSTTGTIVSFCN